MLSISATRGLSDISFGAMHYRKTSTGKVLHICCEKKRKKHPYSYQMNFGILTGRMLYVTDILGKKNANVCINYMSCNYLATYVWYI